MSIPPPPPYSLHPPPTYTRKRDKSRSSYSRPSSREMLTEALQHAQHAVKLDTTGSDKSAIITAYDETIALLERVIARRTQKPGTKADVDRVTDIHARYSDRVRELCLTHDIPLPHHVPPAEASAETPRPTSLPHLHPAGESSPSPPPHTQPPRSYLRASFRPESLLTTGHGTEWEAKSPLPSRFSSTSSSSTSSSSSSSLPTTPIFPDTSKDDDSHECRTWMETAACDAELEEWGQYLSEGENVQVTVATVTPSADWNNMVSVARAESSVYY